MSRRQHQVALADPGFNFKAKVSAPNAEVYVSRNINGQVRFLIHVSQALSSSVD
jgi:hypothetical protein